MPVTGAPADVLDLAGVTVVREGATLLDRVDWQVREGERWALLGPNGAGKTTLLEVAGAALHPTRGTARVLGEALGRVDVFELRPRIGSTSTVHVGRLPPRAPVLDVVLTAAHGVTGRRSRESFDPVDVARAARLLAFFGCGELAERRFASLSDGERKRVLIARALMPDPELLLLDEPAAGLDLGAREALLMRLGRLARDPAAPTSVVVTHHVEEIPRGTTHALLLAHGSVVAAGPVAAVLADEPLSDCFGLPLHVAEHAGRWSARIALRA